MNENDRQITKDSLDTVVSLIPGLNIAWGLSKALYGAGLKLRQQRAMEWVEMVRDNPNMFTEELLRQEYFQDGFVYCLERYLTERNEEKRKYFKNIFLGFSKNNDKAEFELERFFHVLSQLDENAIRTLSRVDIHTPGSYQIFDDTRAIESIYGLVNAGILFLDLSSRYGPVNSPYVYTSNFGRRFILYLELQK